MRILSALPVFSLLGMIGFASPTFAQFSNTSNAPITIDADDSRLESGSAVFSGQVDARQGDVRILTDEMTITGRKGGGVNAAVSDIDTIVAVGNFYYITPTQEVRGQRGIYRQASNDFTVTGNVVLLQNDSVVTGDTLIYNLETEEARMVSNCKGRKCGLSQRVRVLIQNTDQNGTKG
ncbi:lipopolysaccharide export system protein LptA [Litorimonas taeanensis]|uniref:Lipopolysaccharide export system protein LptA n=2 Tax=Litorimonas taeanensis TaxID=568099 RepID=A0A420WDD3_9PROT|nr:lipopolysaccharide export system protein LptA [Litorimonas taeanensis]